MLAYPIENNIPIMLIDKARKLKKESYKPLKKLPFLRDENAPKKIPMGPAINYNKVLE